MSVLTLSNVAFSYDRTPIMNDVNLALSKGEIVGVLGINGAGKTTLFDLICGTKKAHDGAINNAALHPTYLPQILTPPPLLRLHEAAELILQLNAHTPRDPLDFPARLATWSPALAKRYKQISDKKASTCSYGEIRSFFTLPLLLMDSDLVVLDEPTAGVDPELRHYIWLGIRNACQEGASVLVSSHYTQEIASNCSRFYMLAKTRLEEFKSTEAFLARYQAASLDEAFVNAST